MKLRILLTFFVFSCFISLLSAQNKDGAVHLPDTIKYQHVKISSVSITGNDLTRERIITRELDFKIGDSLETFKIGGKPDFSSKRFAPADSSELKLKLGYSRENIINTKLFLTNNLTLEQIDSNRYNLKIDVNERHYWWIFPVIKINAPNFNEWLRDPSWEEVSMGLFFSHNNLWGLGHQFSAIGFYGKSYTFGLGYYIPWIGKGQKVGLRMGAAYQSLYSVEYGSTENKRDMIYEANSERDLKINAALNFRPGLYNYATLKLSAEWVTISDSLLELNPHYLGDSAKSVSSISLYADYYYDSRNSHSYPLKGNLLRGFIDKKGLGILSRDVDIFYYGIDFHFYQTLTKKFYVAEMVKAVSSSGENYPFFYQQNMTEKKDFIRGYDLYTLQGDQMYYFRSNFKYELIKPNVKKTKPGEEKSKFKSLQYAFYLNAFADCGYVTNKFSEGNPYDNKMLYSWGLGLDFVSYYDLVLRFEYAFTSIGTHGFFIAFGMPI
jgi:outer membrane protein assembly factor BamA